MAARQSQVHINALVDCLFKQKKCVNLLTEVVQKLLYVNNGIGKVTYSETGYAAAQVDFLGVYGVTGSVNGSVSVE